jgi:hypothetical protein
VRDHPHDVVFGDAEVEGPVAAVREAAVASHHLAEEGPQRDAAGGPEAHVAVHAEHATEHTPDQIAKATRLGILSRPHQDLCQAAEVKTTGIFGAPQSAHHNRGEDGHEFHNLACAQARMLADLLRSRLLAVAEDVVEDAGTVQGIGGGLGWCRALRHAANDTSDVVQHTAVVVAVERRHEGGQARLAGGIVGQASEQGGKDVVGSDGGLFFGSAYLLTELVEYVVGKLALEQIHQIHVSEILL